jgi:uncharacterized protein (TIGR02118 family)
LIGSPPIPNRRRDRDHARKGDVTMAAYLLVLYGPQADPAKFDAYYQSTHIPIAQTMPGLRGLDLSVGPITALDGSAPFHQVAVLKFDSVADIQAGLASPQGQATAADLANFVTGEVKLLPFECKELGPA